MTNDDLKNQTDEQLMNLYQKGSAAAFQALYERHSSKIYGYLYKRIGHKEKVAEVFQEVFIKIHKSKTLYQHNLPLLPWIFTVTKTVMIDQLRKDKNYLNLELDDKKIQEAVQPTNLASIDLSEYIDRLPEVQRQAIELRYLNDNTFEQIAASLNMSSVNVRKIISRGIKKIKDLIGEDGRHE